MNQLRLLYAVSYTHLDVYKRQELGTEAVINSTIGALMDDHGDLVAFKSVFDVLKGLPDEQICDYAGIPGIPEFLDKVVDACFKSYRPEGHIRAVATPGGTGAVRHAVCNYTEFGDQILICLLYTSESFC